MHLYFYQIEELLEIIDKNQMACFGGGNLIKQEDIKRLLKHGVDYNKLHINRPGTIFNDFNFAMLADSLKAAEENNYNWEQLYAFIKRGNYIPISSRDKFINARVMELNLFDFLGFKNEIAREVIIEGVINKRTTRQIASDLGHKTGRWGFDEQISNIQEALMNEATEFERKKHNLASPSNQTKVNRPLIRVWINGVEKYL